MVTVFEPLFHCWRVAAPTWMRSRAHGSGTVARVARVIVRTLATFFTLRIRFLPRVARVARAALARA